eukprot:scaffold311957_cov41-Prasinocladus_malaysianus.AAC.1
MPSIATVICPSGQREGFLHPLRDGFVRPVQVPDSQRIDHHRRVQAVQLIVALLAVHIHRLLNLHLDHLLVRGGRLLLRRLFGRGAGAGRDAKPAEAAPQRVGALEAPQALEPPTGRERPARGTSRS